MTATEPLGCWAADIPAVPLSPPADPARITSGLHAEDLHDGILPDIPLRYVASPDGVCPTCFYAAPGLCLCYPRRRP